MADVGAKVTAFFVGGGKRALDTTGRRLLPDLYRHFNPMPYDLARVMEPELARQLRSGGHAVWQN